MHTDEKGGRADARGSQASNRQRIREGVTGGLLCETRGGLTQKRAPTHLCGNTACKGKRQGDGRVARCMDRKEDARRGAAGAHIQLPFPTLARALW